MTTLFSFLCLLDFPIVSRSFGRGNKYCFRTVPRRT